jgi:hypothetical protein
MNFIAQIRSNPRLRIGLALITGIIWLSLLLDLRDDNHALVEKYQQTASQLARYSSQQKQGQWIQRAQDAKDVLGAAEGRIWQEPTLGLAQAELRDWLLHELQESKAAMYNVKVSESADDKGGKSGKADDAPADLVHVRATLEFNTDAVALDKFLATLADADHQIVVENLSVKQPRTSMTVATWYKLQANAPTGGASSASASVATAAP